MIKISFSFFKHYPAIIIGVALMTIGYSTAWANPMRSGEQNPACAGHHQHVSMNDRLDKVGERLEIKASQQAAWEAYTKAYRELEDRRAKKPDSNADAATFARYRAERVTDLAKKLTKIADATARLQAVLSEDQRKILNRVTHHSHHKDHEWNHHQSHDGNQEWSHHGDAGHEVQPDDHGGEEHDNAKPQQ